MTSISPALYAATQVASALKFMGAAENTLGQRPPAPVDPSLPGPDNPCFPFEPHSPEVEAPEAIGSPEVEGPEGTTPMPPFPMLPLERARQLALQGTAAIDSALGVRGLVDDEVVTALENAAGQAHRGVELIDQAMGGSGMQSTTPIANRFQSTSMWLNLAGSLLHLDHGTSWPLNPELPPIWPRIPSPGFEPKHAS